MSAYPYNLLKNKNEMEIFFDKLNYIPSVSKHLRIFVYDEGWLADFYLHQNYVIQKR